MRTKKITNLIIAFFLILLISLIFAIIDNDIANLSPYEFGKASGAIMRPFIKILALFGLIVFATKTFGRNEKL